MSHPILVNETNLSYAWARVFLCVMESPLSNPPPVTISLTGFGDGEPAEDHSVRDRLASLLNSHGKNSIDTSAMVVFPYRAWVRHCRPSCKDFSQWCLKRFVPRLKARDKRNQRGLYFERMMNITHYDANGHLHEHNQLEYIINWWRERKEIGKRPRRSGLQVSCFDPRLDHNKAPRLVFPCLQQVGFSYDEEGLIVHAFYPTQFIFDRAYGNYLGLCHLGCFVAHELHMRFTRLNCFVGCAKLGSINKSDASNLEDFLRARIP